MRLTLIALLHWAVVGCGQTPAGKPEKNVGESEPVIGNEGSVPENMTGDNTTTDRSARSQFELTRKFEIKRKAAERGVPEAQSFLGHVYLGDEDYVEAVKWYRKAAEQGHSESQFNLGWMYGYGKGVPFDVVESCAWHLVAATNGFESSKVQLAKAKAQLTPEQLADAEKRATELFEEINANKAK